MTQFSFPKSQRLKSRKHIAALFKEGKSIKVYPFRLLWSEVDSLSTEQIQYTVSVPKRQFKRAVDRNRIKRVIKEAIRLEKFQILNCNIPTGKKVIFMVVFIGSKSPAGPKLKPLIQSLINQLIDAIHPNQ